EERSMPDHLRNRMPYAEVYSTLARAVGLALLLLFVTATSFAQTTTGTILGTVTDPSGALIAGAKVSIISQETGAARVLATNPQGLYVGSLLPVGTYTVEVQQQGFKTQTTRDILLQVNQTARIDFTMQVGAVTQNVDVTAASVLLKTDRSDVGTVIGERSVVEIPLNGRNFLQLATLAPGTIDIDHVDFVLGANRGAVI